MFASKDQFFTRSSAGYQLTRSLRFRSSASAYLNRTFGTPTSTTIWTWSAWVKRGGLGGTYRLFGASTSTYLTFNSSDQLNLTLNGVSAATSTAVFRDPSSWYHVVYQQNGSAQTIYVNNSSVATGTTAASIFNTAIAHQIAATNTTNYFDGYLAEINFIDGQALTPSSFGQSDATTGVWVPKKYTGTYGNNGFYLPFTDTSSTTNLVKDSSGNANNWTPNNISLTAGATYDSMIDVPYCTGQINGTQPSGNYPVGNPVQGNGSTFSTGNLTWNAVTTSGPAVSTMVLPNTGKWYWEVTVSTVAEMTVGLQSITNLAYSARTGYYRAGGASTGIVIEGTLQTYAPASYTNGDVISVAFNADSSQITWYKNNVQQGGPFSLTSVTNLVPVIVQASGAGTCTGTVNFGQQPFTYSIPSGYKALCAPNLASPTIKNGAGYMAATTYTGTGASQSVANTASGASLSFQPDLVWIKSRSAATNNNLFDAIRGTTNYLISNSTAANASNANTLTAFNSNGFTVGTDASSIGVNVSAATYVGWQWLAGAGTTSSNTSGSITSTVCVNTTSGFSVVTYTGTGANATVGHGLGVALNMVIVKRRDTTGNWGTWHTSIANTNYLLLNTTAASTSGTTYWNSTSPTSSVFSIGTSTDVNANTGTYVAYCFAPIAGYSAFGSYTGNGSSDGPFVYCGFRPAFVMYKNITTAADWVILDKNRPGYNVIGGNLYPDLAAAEDTQTKADFVSNGFKIRVDSTSGNTNSTSNVYIYAAFAENPFNYSNAR